MTMQDALAVLESSPQLQALFGGGANSAWVADIEAGNRRPEPPIRFATLAPETPEQAILSYGREALRRLHWWAGLCMDRADARGLTSDAPWSGQDAMAEIIEAADHLAAALNDGGDDTAIDAASRAVCEAIDGAKDAALGDAEASGRRGTPEYDQAIEVDESPLLSILRGFNVIESIRREARDGLRSPLQARADAADEFAFGWLAS